MTQENKFTQQIAEIVKRAIAEKAFQPPLLPEVALSLSEMARRPETTIKDVEQVVSRDPTVAARVVATANSAFHSRGTPIRSLRSAIMRLGLSEVRDVAFQVVAQTRIFRVPMYAERTRVLFETSLASGLIAREICRTLRFESELAYLCGLLHDMGEAILLAIIGDHMKLQARGIPDIVEIHSILSKYHAQAGALVCRIWGLPELIADAIMYHHFPERSNNTAQMPLIMAIADRLILHAGIGCRAEPADPLSEELFYRVNLSPDQVTSLLTFALDLAENREGWLL